MNQNMTLKEIPPIIGILISIAGGLAWLIYWTGRVYKEAYFGQFNIPYEMLGFDARYYVYGSWSTLMVSISGLFLTVNTAFGWLGWKQWSISASFWLFTISSVLLLSAAVLVLYSGGYLGLTPTSFQTDGSIAKMVLGSTDVILILMLIPSIVISALSFHIQCKVFAIIGTKICDIYKSSANEAIGITTLWIFIGLLSAWIMLGISAQVMGRYHGQKAIAEGKMGVRAAKAFDKWWLFVVRTEDGRNFLYDSKEKKACYVKDDQIAELRDFSFLALKAKEDRTKLGHEEKGAVK